jgi:thiol-disulfide isomerase/thioredoxin
MGQAPPAASRNATKMEFFVVRPEFAAELMLCVMLKGEGVADTEEGALVYALSAAVETMKAPYADPVACFSCGAQFPHRKPAPAFVIGIEQDGYFYWKPFCADCLKLSDAELLERFAEAFQAEFPTARRVAD